MVATGAVGAALSPGPPPQLTRGLHKVRQLRNEVAAIAAMAANSSAAQAEFLTGATGKYADQGGPLPQPGLFVCPQRQAGC